MPTYFNNAVSLKNAIRFFILAFFIISILIIDYEFFSRVTYTLDNLSLYFYISGILLVTAITLGIQYFIFNDSTYYYYTIYILLSLTYFTSVHLWDNSVISVFPLWFEVFYSHSSLPLLTLIYLFYTHFAIGFLNLKNGFPKVYKTMIYIIRAYQLLFFLSIFILFFIRVPEIYIPIRTVILLSCIPVGFVSIYILYTKVKSIITIIFCTGTLCFFCGSVFGFLFSYGWLTMPPIFPFNQWFFYTEAGTVLEIILFTSSFAFRNKLMLQEDLIIKENLIIQMKDNYEKEIKLQNIRNEISANLHDDIGSSISNINILNELAQRHINSPEKAATYLKNAGADIENIRENLGDIVWNLNPRFDDDLSGLFIRMKRYAADMLEGKNIIPHFHFPPASACNQLNMKYRKDLYLIFKEAINNMAKYSGASNGSVIVKITVNTLQVRISDDGIGFDPRKSTSGNGLHNITQRALACKGEIDITSLKNKGTAITLKIPLL